MLDVATMGAEGILFTPAVGYALSRILALLLIPTMPIVVALRAVHLIGPARTHSTPALEILALVIGVLAAPVLLSASVIGPLLGFGNIFRIGGPWDLGFSGFLTLRALPLLQAPLALFHAVADGVSGPDARGVAILLGTLAALVIVGPVLVLRSRNGLASTVRNSILVFWGAYATMYTLVSLLWMANRLNFWCFLVLFVAMSFRRD